MEGVATRLVVAVVVGLVVLWGVLTAALLLLRPKDMDLREAAKVVPDTVRLLRSLAADRSLPKGVRRRLLIALVWLVSPFDLIPEFVPVLGYADDVLIVALVLRSVVRRAGAEAVERHWPGTPEGLALLRRIARL